MCFKPPKPPKVLPDPALEAQMAAAKLDERERRSADKQLRLEQAIALGAGSYGRRALISGGKGGIGYAPAGVRPLLI